MKNLKFAKPKITHDKFRVGNLYKIISEDENFLNVLVGDEIRKVKKDNFEILNCIFNSKKKTE